MRTMDRRQAFKILAASPLALSALPSCAAARASRPAGPSSFAPARPPREFRAVWVATIDNIDWPSRPALPAEAQRDEIDRILDTAQSLELNAIILQVRPTADAIYRSDIEPWSAFLTGRQGDPPSPEYDPLEYWVRAAHARGIDLHAWVNPFRVRHPKSIGPDAPSHVSRLFPRLVREYDGYLWLDPGAAEAREITMRVIDDLLTRYDLDGLHMDDYFYPYPKPGTPFPDAAIHAVYRRNGGTLGHDDWRRDNINRCVRDINTLVHHRRPGVLFTVSPFGIWRPGHPPGVVGFDAYAGLYADSRRWLGEGWCDALMPQLYWPIASKGQPFEPLLNWWAEQNPRERHLWPGLYLTRIQPQSAGADAGWPVHEILAQIAAVRREHRATGFALFSMVGLLDNRRGITGLLQAGPLAGPALVPESPWLDAPRPGAPGVIAINNGGGSRGGDIRLEITPATGPATRRFVLQLDPGLGGGPGWIMPAGGSGTARTTLAPRTPPPPGTALLVTPIGANGVTGSTTRAML